MSNRPGVFKIIMIDDDEEDFLIIKSLLEECMDKPFDFEWFGNIETFMSLACSGNHDVSLVDYRLDDHTGLELIMKLKLLCPDKPAILLTGWMNAEIMDAAQKFGADSFLNKTSLDGPTLCRTIDKVTRSFLT